MKTQNRWVYVFSFLYPLSVIAGNTLGGHFARSGAVVGLVIYPLLDWLLGESESNNLEDSEPFYFDTILMVHAVLQIVCLLSLALLIQRDGWNYFAVLASISTGLNSGISSIVIAHELIHRRYAFQRVTGVFLLWTVNYMHFYFEHVRGHHKSVATIEDPASARVDENFWFFLIRTIPGQFINAYKIMNPRANSWLLNPVFLFLIVQIVSWIVVYFLLGKYILFAWLIQSAFAVFLLEYVNYIRHWGLQRPVGSRAQPEHSWQSNHRWSRWTLVELTRHADHHYIASREYWKLRTYRESPNLPTGYYGCFWLAVIPPIWRKVMKKRLPKPSI